MAAADSSQMLKAELHTGELLAETLHQQREALVARDLDRITELTVALEGQMERFRAVVDARVAALEGGSEMLSDADAHLLQRVRHTEGRVLRLAELNQDLIADRLACVGAMLSTMGITDATGYGGRASSAVSLGALSRSA